MTVVEEDLNAAVEMFQEGKNMMMHFYRNQIHQFTLLSLKAHTSTAATVWNATYSCGLQCCLLLYLHLYNGEEHLKQLLNDIFTLAVTLNIFEAFY